jgi:hypothetical protein
MDREKDVPAVRPRLPTAAEAVMLCRHVVLVETGLNLPSSCLDHGVCKLFCEPCPPPAPISVLA